MVGKASATAGFRRASRASRLLALSLALSLPMPAAAQTAQDIVVGVPNWPSARATANIIKVVIEDHLGSQVELRDMASPDIFAGMDDGSVAVHPEAWLPNYAELTAEYVERRGTVRESQHRVEASQNICTTREIAEEFGVRSLADLASPAKAALFDTDGDGRGEMWIGDATWTSTSIEKIRARELRLRPHDDAARGARGSGARHDRRVDGRRQAGRLLLLPAALPLSAPRYRRRSKSRRTIRPAGRSCFPATIPTGWRSPRPGWPGRRRISRSTSPRRWKTDRPEVAAVLKAMSFTPEEVAEMSYALVIERQDPYAYAKSWAAANPDRVEAWVAGP